MKATITHDDVDLDMTSLDGHTANDLYRMYLSEYLVEDTSVPKDETAATSMMIDGNSIRTDHLQGGRPSQQVWNWPYVPRQVSDWPNDESKRYWIGPLHAPDEGIDLDKYADWKEDEGICDVRKHAQSLEDASDFAGACYVWAQIAEHYKSEFHQHSSIITNDEIFIRCLSGSALRTSIGCILNSYLAQFPDLCELIRSSDQNLPQETFKAVVKYKHDWNCSSTRYIFMMMLKYATDIACLEDNSWICPVCITTFDSIRQITDLDLRETISLRQDIAHLLVKSACRHAWSMRSTDDYWTLSSSERRTLEAQQIRVLTDGLEAIYMQITADQRSLCGSEAEATISSDLDLVRYYTLVGDSEKAKAKASYWYLLTRDCVGEDHDITFRCLASFSTVLLESGSPEEAGLLVHDCLTKYRDISEERITIFLHDNAREKRQRDWVEMTEIRSKLEQHDSPVNSVWADYRLYTLRIGTISFLPSYPSETENESLIYKAASRVNNPASRDYIRESLSGNSPRSWVQFGNFAFNALQRNDKFLEIQVPYIPYVYFMASLAYKAGIPYLEYVKGPNNGPLAFRRPEEAAILLDTVQKQQNGNSNLLTHNLGIKKGLQIEFDKDTFTIQIKGFFNNVPSEVVLSSELYVDLVSSQWAEYQDLVVHRLPEKVTGIKIKEGLYLPCLGYISGTWTDFDVCQQRKLFELYVVDACFLPVGVNAELPMFAFRRKKPEELQYHEGKKSPTFLDRGFINRALGKVISSEKRAFCARLNPSFHKPSRHYRCTMRIIGAMATGKFPMDNDDLSFWDEMAVREKWDRDFETREPTTDAERAVLAADLKAEDERRRAWDEKHTAERESEGELLPNVR